MHPSTLAKRGIVFLSLAFIAFYFYGLDHLPLLGPDEPRYAEVARQMFLRHDLITPTLGGHLWFEKPALLYWMMMASFKLFGVSEWSARLPAASSGLLTIVGVFVIAHRIDGNNRDYKLPGYPFYCALVAATSSGIVIFSRAASFDIVLTMTTTWALGFYVLHEFNPQEKKRRLYLAGFYVSIGVSLLAKGLVGIIIPIGVVKLYYLLRRRLPRRDTLASVLWGIPLAVLVSATWYAPVIWRHGWPFIDQFFIQHHFVRYASDKFHHGQPIFYYLLVVPLFALPWTPFLIDGLLQLRSWFRRVNLPAAGQTESQLPQLMVFAFAWFVFPVVFFSFSGSKLPGYILPMLPAAALIIGERLWRFSSDENVRHRASRTTAALCLLFAVGVLAYHWRTGALSLACSLLIAAPLLVAGVLPFLLPHRRTVSVMVFGAATILVVIVALNCLGPLAGEDESSKQLLQLAGARGYSQTAIYGMQRSDRTPEFYAAGRVVYDSDGEPIMYAGPEQVIEESRRRNDVILTFVPIAEVSRLTGMASAQTEVIGNNGRYAIVAVRAR